ncbi:LuxR C-terminal-related transcriptional regulator [Gellertiella hungarica]|uniref:LuxR C-terminal-related transcriptional regulator n=1 Tax=Gellertiella hungarica TaxID=1572859 RepID=UPI0016114988
MINTGRQTLLTGELAAAKSREALRIALGNMRQSFNYDFVSLLRIPSEQEKILGPLIHESTLPQAFLRDFDRGQMLTHCPVSIKVRRSMLPISWTVDDLKGPGSKQPVVELCDLMGRHGLSSGVIISFFLSDGHRYGLRFDGARSALTQSEINELSMLSLQALEVFGHITMSRDAQHNPLSARELEVVSWTAQGKTSVEIGQILTLSDHTVNAYLTNAIRKLDCVNRTQLVAKALRLKLIA